MMFLDLGKRFDLLNSSSYSNYSSVHCDLFSLSFHFDSFTFSASIHFACDIQLHSRVQAREACLNHAWATLAHKLYRNLRSDVLGISEAPFGGGGIDYVATSWHQDGEGER